jgi:hypothetical protein
MGHWGGFNVSGGILRIGCPNKLGRKGVVMVKGESEIVNTRQTYYGFDNSGIKPIAILPTPVLGGQAHECRQMPPSG